MVPSRQDRRRTRVVTIGHLALAPVLAIDRPATRLIAQARLVLRVTATLRVGVEVLHDAFVVTHRVRSLG